MSSNKLFLSILEFRPRPQTVPVLNRRKGHTMTVGYMKRFYHKFLKLPANSSLATRNGKLKIKTVPCCRTYLGSKLFLEPLVISLKNMDSPLQASPLPVSIKPSFCTLTVVRQYLR